MSRNSSAKRPYSFMISSSKLRTPSLTCTTPSLAQPYIHLSRDTNHHKACYTQPPASQTPCLPGSGRHLAYRTRGVAIGLPCRWLHIQSHLLGHISISMITSKIEERRHTISMATSAVVRTRCMRVVMAPDIRAGCSDIALVFVGRVDASLANGFVGW
jgi:hypothetical protein